MVSRPLIIWINDSALKFAWPIGAAEWIAVLRWTTKYQIYNAMYVTVISTLCFIHHLSEI